MNRKNWLALIGFVLLSQAAGLIGSIFTASAIDDWYATLLKPEFAPPNWVFGPVWTTLYLLMGIAAFLVWRTGGRKVTVALRIFFLQLVLNTLWSLIFFGAPSLMISGFTNIGIAFIEIIFLWLAILATIIAFARISKIAAWLLVPYILWVSFAAYLNYTFYVLN